MRSTLFLALALATAAAAMPPPPSPAERAAADAERAAARAAGVDVSTLRARRDLTRLRDNLGVASLAEHREAIAIKRSATLDYLEGMQRSEISDTLANARRYGMLARALERLEAEKGALLRWVLRREGWQAALLPGEPPVRGIPGAP